MGDGRPVVLLHGLFSDAHMNWIKFGHAALISAAGFRVIGYAPGDTAVAMHAAGVTVIHSMDDLLGTIGA